MTETETLILVIVAVAGVIYASATGYFEEKKKNPQTEFNVVTFATSILRSLPGIIASVTVLGFTNLFDGGLVEILTKLGAAFSSGIASDIVLKRTWRSVKKE